MKDQKLKVIVEDFISGLRKKAKCNHAGNCYAVSQILKPYLSCLFGINTLICNAKVKQGRKRINHYYLLRVKDGLIVDATASQFKDPDGKKMPKVYIGTKPDWYID